MALINPCSSSLLATHHTYIVVIPSSSPFFLRVSSNEPLNIQSRKYSSKKGKEQKKDDGKFKLAAEFELDNLSEEDFVKKLESVIKTFPESLSDPYYKRSVHPVYDKWMPLNHKFFYLKLTSENKTIFPLYSKKTFWLVAVKYGEKVVVFQEKLKFAEVCKIMEDKEHIKLENIDYKSVIFDPDSVSYSYIALKSSIEYLSFGLYKEDPNKFYQGLNRMFGLGCCFVLKDWAAFFGYAFKYKKRKARLPTTRMVNCRKSWKDISQYINTRGEKEVSVERVKISFDKVRKILFTLHSKQGTHQEKVSLGPPKPRRVGWVNPHPDRIKPNPNVPPNVPKRKYSTNVPVVSSGWMFGSPRTRNLSKLFTVWLRGIR